MREADTDRPSAWSRCPSSTASERSGNGARLFRAAGSLLFSFLVLAAPVLADEPRHPTFRELVFPAGPRIMDRVFVDLDGDGAKDLLLVRGREVSLFLQKRGAFLPENPDQKFNFVDQAILWDDGDVDGDGRPEILFLTSSGVSYYKWENGRLSFLPHTLLETPVSSILRVASKDEIRHKHFYQDLDGDGVPDLLLPGEGCFLLYRGRKGGGFGPPEYLAMRPDVNIDAGGESPTSQAISSFWYPEPVSGDFDGDGRRDIFIHQRDQVSVFMQGRDGRYGPQPTLALPLEFTGPLDEGRFKLDFQLPTKFVDIDGDGITDIVATHIGRATTYVFKGRKGRRDLKTPDVVLKLPGITFLDFIVDLDHDGHPDLVLARTDRPGLWDIMKILVTKEVPVEALVFHGGASPLFPPTPDYRREVEVPLLFSSARRGINIGTSAVVSVLGDFDGDGMNDLILRSAEDRIAVHPGRKGRGFADEPAFELEVASMDGYRFLEPMCEDLNGDGVSDLSLAYYSWDGKADKLVILLSEGAPKRGAPPPGAPVPPPPAPAPQRRSTVPPARTGEQ